MKRYISPETAVLDIKTTTPLAMSADSSETMNEALMGSMGIETLNEGESYVW